MAVKELAQPLKYLKWHLKNKVVYRVWSLYNKRTRTSAGNA